MKKIHHNIWLVCMAVALSLAACTDDDGPTVKDKPTAVYPEIRLGVSEMTMAADSRASAPMSPDLEKYVRTAAIFEFDNEGIHIKNDGLTYHFIDFVAGTVDGNTGVGDVTDSDHGIVETTLKGIAFEYGISYTKGTLCVVANVTQDQVDDLYENYREEGQSYGRLKLEKFQTWSLPFEYEENKTGTYDESVSGHVKNMYMFGYYKGSIDPATSEAISIDLGRLASRLDITVVNETGKELDKRLGYHFDNVCRSAFFFPMKMSVPETFDVGMTRTVICAGTEMMEGDVVDLRELVQTTFPCKPESTDSETNSEKYSHTAYFYVAAHSADKEADATMLHLYYGRRIADVNHEDLSHTVQIPMCNVHPSEAASVTNGYSLSRNTRYHFTIRLKKAGASPAAASRSVEYGEQPGEYIVYLPE